jgi:hypothetical protein
MIKKAKIEKKTRRRRLVAWCHKKTLEMAMGLDNLVTTTSKLQGPSVVVNDNIGPEDNYKLPGLWGFYLAS